MAITSAEQVVGKTLFAKRPVTLLDSSYKAIRVIPSGERIGQVFAWEERGGDLFWMLHENGKPVFVLHNPKTLDFEALQEQGTKTVEEQIKEKEDQDKPWYEKLFDKTADWLKPLIYTVIIIVAVYLTIKLIISFLKS